MPMIRELKYKLSWVPPEKVVLDEHGDHDIDQVADCTVCKLFPNETEAREFAKGIKDYFGIPVLSLVQWDYADGLAKELGESPQWIELETLELDHESED